MKLETLTEKIEGLEKTLLAIDEINGICQQAICHGNRPIDLERCANVLNYLIEPAMYQIEAVRMLLGEIAADVAQSSTPGSLKCS